VAYVFFIYLLPVTALHIVSSSMKIDCSVQKLNVRC